MSHTELHGRGEYVSMRDGIRLAVSTKPGKDTDKHPAVVVTIRDWRAMALRN